MGHNSSLCIRGPSTSALHHSPIILSWAIQFAINSLCDADLPCTTCCICMHHLVLNSALLCIGLHQTLHLLVSLCITLCHPMSLSAATHVLLLCYSCQCVKAHINVCVTYCTYLSLVIKCTIFHPPFLLFTLWCRFHTVCSVSVLAVWLPLQMEAVDLGASADI